MKKNQQAIEENLITVEGANALAFFMPLLILPDGLYLFR